MDEKTLEDIKTEASEPVEVIVKEKKSAPPPSFDYDDYTPGEDEIVETEKEIAEIVKKRTTDGT